MAVPAWLTAVSWIFIGLGLVSAALILADIRLRGYRQQLKVMEAVWPLTALYAGPLAVAAWIRWGRPMSRTQTMASGGGMPRRACRAGRTGPRSPSAPPTAARAACSAT